jgi:hypothetical protein
VNIEFASLLSHSTGPLTSTSRGLELTSIVSQVPHCFHLSFQGSVVIRLVGALCNYNYYQFVRDVEAVSKFDCIVNEIHSYPKSYLKTILGSYSRKLPQGL